MTAMINYIIDISRISLTVYEWQLHLFVILFSYYKDSFVHPFVPSVKKILPKFVTIATITNNKQ